jgi:putative oxidoreductase
MIGTKKDIKTMSNILDLIGRIFISLIFLLSGINKIGNYEGTVGWMESLGMPGIFLIPAIIFEIGAPILIMIGYKVKISAALLSLFCIVTAVIFHNDFSNQMEFISFMKNIALAGGFLFLVVNETKDFSLDKKLNKS